MKATLELGFGDVGIAALKGDSGNHGIIFHRNTGGKIGENTEAGECRSEEFSPEIFLEITSVSAESIQVLIDKLTEAKSYF